MCTFKTPFSRILEQMAGVVFAVVILTAVAQAQDVQAVIQKLRTIRIPTVQLEDVTLLEAVEFLNTTAIAQDKNEPDPAKKGLGIVVDLPEGTDALPLITLELNEVPLIVALQAIAQLAQCRYRIDPLGVTISTSESDRRQLHSKTFPVPPAFAEMSTSLLADVEVPEGDEPAEAVLKILGIDFPEGASARFERSMTQLVVVNFMPDLDVIGNYVQQTQNDVLKNVSASVEIFRLSADLGSSMMKRYNDRDPDALPLADQLKAQADEGTALLIASHMLATPSGRRANIQKGDSIEYISDYVAVDGKDTKVRKQVFHGTKVTIDPVVGSDGFTIDMNIAVVHSIGDLKVVQMKSIAPVSGEEMEIRAVSVEQLTLKSSIALYDGTTRLLEMFEGSPEFPDESWFVLLSVSLIDPQSGLPLRPK